MGKWQLVDPLSLSLSVAISAIFLARTIFHLLASTGILLQCVFRIHDLCPMNAYRAVNTFSGHRIVSFSPNINFL